MNTTPKTTLVLLADAADELHKLADRLTDAAEELLPETPTPAPLVLPTVDEASEAVSIAAHQGGSYTDYAQAVLDLIASRVPVWVPVEPGATIKAGTRYRTEFPADGDAYEHVSKGGPVPLSGDGKWFIDPRTVPAEDPRVAVVVEWLFDPSRDDEREDAADLLARLDAVRADA